MAYAWKMPSIGIDYDAKDSDVMSYFALDKIIKPEDLEKTLAEYR
jgi:polysaccharide pyruvyl transferase WcaK-like protein